MLPVKDRLEVVASWERARKKNVDVGPTVALYLPQLLELVCRTPRLRLRLGFETEGAMKPAIKNIVKHRNKVMHPVQHLVLDQGEVKELLASTRQTLTMSERLLGPEATPDHIESRDAPPSPGGDDVNPQAGDDGLRD